MYSIRDLWCIYDASKWKAVFTQTQNGRRVLPVIRYSDFCTGMALWGEGVHRPSNSAGVQVWPGLRYCTQGERLPADHMLQLGTNLSPISDSIYGSD
jgi:hypothetical protein